MIHTPKDDKRGHSVGILGETRSGRVPDIHNMKPNQRGRVKPPCGGDGQQGGLGTGPTDIFCAEKPGGQL